MSAFKAYDIRGIWGKDIDEELCYRVGYFLPSLLGSDHVLVGRDIRLSSDSAHDALVRGVLDSGADVWDIGLATTPMVYFSTVFLNADASVQITASHNPAEYNGLKISRCGAIPVGGESGLKDLERMCSEGSITIAPQRGKVIDKSAVRDDYVAFLKPDAASITGLDISVDCSFGMANLIVKDILGISVHYIYDHYDGTFPAHEPNPLVPENVKALKALVKKTGADIGVIYDGDADRVMFVDEKGEFISPDLMIAVLGHYFLEKRGEKGIVLQDIRSSKAVGEHLVPMGAEMHTWKVGRAFAARKLRELDGVYGGELAGHYYFRDFFYSDSGLLASILILNVVADMKKKGISVSSLIAGIARYKNSGEINFRVEDKKGAMDAVRDFFTAAEKPSAMMDFDGYRVEFPQWWFNIRPSNTEPYLRFICEAVSDELLSEKVSAVETILSGRFGAVRS